MKDCLKLFTKLNSVNIIAYSHHAPLTSWISLLMPSLRELKLYHVNYSSHEVDAICAKLLELTRLEKIHLDTITHQSLHKFLKVLQARLDANPITEICLQNIEIYECCLNHLMEFHVRYFEWWWYKSNGTMTSAELENRCVESGAICVKKTEEYIIFQWG